MRHPELSVTDLVASGPLLRRILRPLMRAREALWMKAKGLHA